MTRHESTLVRPDGTEIMVLVTASRVDEHAGGAHLVMHIENITERKMLESELIHRALHDELTGLASRGLLMQRLSQVTASRGRDGRVAVLFIDLDHFKGVNDEYGHAVGDELLQRFATRLRDSVRPTDTVARLGGDEFAVLCEADGDVNVRSVSERIVQITRQPFALSVGDVTVSASLGVVVTDDTPAQPETLLAAADEAMYRAKAAGRDQYVIDSAWGLNTRRVARDAPGADAS